MTDPDFDTASGVSGADVVKESLRQKCIWKLYGGEDAPSADQASKKCGCLGGGCFEMCMVACSDVAPT